jgi:hypothetical protein
MRVVKGCEFSIGFSSCELSRPNRRAVYSGQARLGNGDGLELQFASPPVATA